MLYRVVISRGFLGRPGLLVEWIRLLTVHGRRGLWGLTDYCFRPICINTSIVKVMFSFVNYL